MKTVLNSGFKSTLFVTLFFLLLSSCASTLHYLEGTKESGQGITELDNIKINGLKHAVLIRGKNTDNPILLHIHGLGVPSMCFAFDEYTNDTVKENRFTVVHYDQRGFGKTYRHGRHGKKYINTSQYVSDAEELIRYLQKRFNRKKVYLLAESWGSVIGANLVSLHPEWFYAYIAVPQVADVNKFMDEIYEFSLNSATADSNMKAVDEIYKAGKPAPELSKKKLTRSIAVTGKWMEYYNLKRYRGQDMTGYFFGCLWKAPEYSLFDFTGTLKGMQKTAPLLNKELMNLNLIEDIKQIHVPFYVIIGEYDLHFQTSKEFFDRVKAEKKYWMPVKNAGHMVRGEQYQDFDNLLYNTILPETFTGE